MSGHPRRTGAQFRPPLSPVWIVEPYGDRHACWGCGNETDTKPNSLTGLRLCGYCQDLYEVDRDNQRRAMPS